MALVAAMHELQKKYHRLHWGHNGDPCLRRCRNWNSWRGCL